MAYMEVIEKDDNLIENKTEITLLETKFTALGKTLADEPGKIWTDLVAGNLLSQQALVTLNQSQLDLENRFKLFKTEFNNFLGTIANKVSNLSSITYDLGINEWAIKYIPNVTPASYQQVLTDITGGEKKLFEGIAESSESKIIQNLTAIQEWSKGKLYGSNCEYFKSGLSVGDTSIGWGIVSTTGPCHWSLERGIENNKSRVIATNLNLLKVGQSSSVRVRGGSARDYTVSITRRSLGTVSENDGYFIYSSNSLDGPHSGSFHLKRIVSPHFVNNDPTLLWLKSRNFL